MVWNIPLASSDPSPGHAVPQILVQLLTGTAWDTEQSLAQGKQSSAEAKPAACCQHNFHIENHSSVPANKLKAISAETRTDTLNTSEEMLFLVKHLWTLQGQE